MPQPAGAPAPAATVTPTLWKALAEAGVLGLAIEESSAAPGRSDRLGVFCVEAGRALCPRVVHSTLYAALAIDWLGGPELGAGCPRLASGSSARPPRAVQPARRAACTALRATATGTAGG